MTDWLGLHIGAATRTDATPAEFGSERPTVSRLPVDRRPMREIANAVEELMDCSAWLAKTEFLASKAEPLLGPTPATHPPEVAEGLAICSAPCAGLCIDADAEPTRQRRGLRLRMW